MDIRLSRTDLDGLLRLIDSGQVAELRETCKDISQQPAVSWASTAKSSKCCTVLDSFGSYFDRGVAAASMASPLPAQALNHAQLYGATAAHSDALRVWTIDRSGTVERTAYLLSSAHQLDGSPQLPTIDDVRENIRISNVGSDRLEAGLDLISGGLRSVEKSDDDVVSGDGVVTSSPSLAINAIWLANHNHWVGRLKQDTRGTWSEDEYFAVARIINIAQYQHTVFTEFADALAAKSANIDTAFDAADTEVSFSEAISFIDSAGHSRQISLANIFSLEAERHSGASPETSGHVSTGYPGRLSDQEAVLRLLQLTASQNDDDGRTPRPSSLNQIRAELFVLTGLTSLRPYESWTDFQTRNDLSDDVIADLQQAYPEGIESLDAWLGGLAEQPAHGQLGETFAAIARTSLEEKAASAPLLVDLLDGLPLKGAIEHSTFADIVARATGLTGLPEDLLLADAAVLDQENVDNIPVAVINGTELGEVIFGTSGIDAIYGHGGDDILVADPNAGASLETGEDEFQELAEILAALSPTSDGDGTIVQAGESAMAGVLADPSPVGSQEARTSDTGTGLPGTTKASWTDSGDLLDGGGGNDILIGSEHGDILIGGTGDDVLSGGIGNDKASGGSGDDLVSGGSGNDVLHGGDGQDLIHGGSGDDQITGGAGSDHLSGGSGNDQIWGDDDDDQDTSLNYMNSQPDDEFFGTSANDMINTGHGTDVVVAGSGHDIVSTGPSRDHVDGGDHNDWIDAGSGNDIAWGGSGDDTLFGGSGDDVLIGGSGNDKLYGDSGNDRLEGGSGENLYDAGSGDDWITIVSGHDTVVLRPGFGNDIVAGFDSVSSGSGGQNRIDVSAYGIDKDNFGTDLLVLAAGEDTVIVVGDDTLTLLAVDSRTVDRNDFIFS